MAGAAFGSTLKLCGAAGEALDEFGNGFGVNLGSAGFVFLQFVYFDALLERNRYSCRSRRPSWGHSPPHVAPDSSKVVSEGQVRLAKKVSVQGALSDVRKLLGIGFFCDSDGPQSCTRGGKGVWSLILGTLIIIYK